MTLFSRCTTRQLRILRRHSQIAEFGPGVELAQEGDPGDALCLILGGELQP